jgi:hypothetical protein
MQAGDIKPTLHEIIARLKEIARNTNNNACCEATTSAGQNSSIPKGFGSVSVVQLTSGVVNITMSDGTVFQLSAVGQVYVVSAPDFEYLAAFPISGTATWEWSAIK